MPDDCPECLRLRDKLDRARQTVEAEGEEARRLRWELSLFQKAVENLAQHVSAEVYESAIEVLQTSRPSRASSSQFQLVCCDPLRQTGGDVPVTITPSTQTPMKPLTERLRSRAQVFRYGPAKDFELSDLLNEAAQKLEATENALKTWSDWAHGVEACGKHCPIKDLS